MRTSQPASRRHADSCRRFAEFDANTASVGHDDAMIGSVHRASGNGRRARGATAGAPALETQAIGRVIARTTLAESSP
jgi:hypothetical protein